MIGIRAPSSGGHIAAAPAPRMSWPSEAGAAVKLLFFSIVCMGLLGIPVTPEFSISVSLVAVYFLLTHLFLKKMVRIEPSAVFLFGICILTGILSILANLSGDFSFSSFVLFIVLYFPLVFSLAPTNPPGQIYHLGLRYYTNIVLFLAVCAIVQYGLQYVIHSDWLFNPSLLLPDSLRAAGRFNHAIPVNGHFKANGFFQREPSGLSMHLALALIVELSVMRRYWRIGIIAIAMALSYSGSGILIAMVGLLIPTNMAALRRSAILLLSALAFWVLFSDMLGLNVFLDRLHEFDTPNTSGYARFVAPFDLVRYGLSLSWWSGLFGSGPGTIQAAIASIHTTFEINDPTWAKLLFEYGFVGAGSIAAFIFEVFRGSSAPIGLKLAMFYAWLASGGQMLKPDMLALLMGLIVLARVSRQSPVPVPAAALRLRAASPGYAR